MVANKKSAIHNAKAKQIVVKKRSAAKSHVAVESEEKVAINRRENRDRRLTADRRSQNIPVAVEQRVMERRVKVNRRRQIDPTTCERDYTLDEIEFMSAIELYKRHSGRMFPTCSEVLEVLKSLGYAKQSASEPSAPPLVIAPLAAMAAGAASATV